MGLSAGHFLKCSQENAAKFLSFYTSSHYYLSISYGNKKNKVFSNYDDFPGFKEKSVRAIISDNNGSLWVSGGSGLTKLDFKNKKNAKDTLAFFCF